MPHLRRAFEGFEAEVLPLLRSHSVSSMLYVRWRHDSSRWWYDFLAHQLGGDVGVLEIFERNLQCLKDRTAEEEYGRIEFYLGDARRPEEYFPKERYDLIFWDHGPEHVSEDDLITCTPKLLDHAGKALVYCCPWGDWPQGGEAGNEHEEHKTAVTDRMLSDLGFDVLATGKRDTGRANS